MVLESNTINVGKIRRGENVSTSRSNHCGEAEFALLLPALRPKMFSGSSIEPRNEQTEAEQKQNRTGAPDAQEGEHPGEGEEAGGPDHQRR